MQGYNKSQFVISPSGRNYKITVRVDNNKTKTTFDDIIEDYNTVREIEKTLSCLQKVKDDYEKLWSNNDFLRQFFDEKDWDYVGHVNMSIIPFMRGDGNEDHRVDMIIIIGDTVKKDYPYGTIKRIIIDQKEIEDPNTKEIIREDNYIITTDWVNYNPKGGNVPCILDREHYKYYKLSSQNDNYYTTIYNENKIEAKYRVMSPRNFMSHAKRNYRGELVKATPEEGWKRYKKEYETEWIFEGVYRCLLPIKQYLENRFDSLWFEEIYGIIHMPKETSDGEMMNAMNEAIKHQKTQVRLSL
jgi:hypothetical protein